MPHAVIAHVSPAPDIKMREDDIALAQAVPGIDIIFGSHSHRKEDLFKIPGTNTWMISPFQYATYVSKLELQFSDGALSGVTGGLARMGADLLPEPRITALVDPMQADLQADPQYAALFQPIGTAAVELSTDGQFTGEAVLGNFVMDIFRAAAQSNMALATASGFREPIPPGTILEEGFRAAMPYKNGVLVYTMTGAQIQDLLNLSVSRAGSDFFSQVSGVRFNIVNGQAGNIQLLKDAANPAAGYSPLDRAATYTVATTDFQGKLAGRLQGYLRRRPASATPASPIFAICCATRSRPTARSARRWMAGSPAARQPRRPLRPRNCPTPAEAPGLRWPRRCSAPA